MGFVSALAPKDLEKAKEELNEDPKTRDETIKGKENLFIQEEKNFNLFGALKK